MMIFLAVQPPSQPPDLTSNTNTLRRADRVNRYNQQHAHAQSVRVTTTGAVTGLDMGEGGEFIKIHLLRVIVPNLF